MTKFCVWRTQREETPDYEGDIPRYTGANSFEEGVQAATKWHKRDKAEIASYSNPDDPYIPVIKNRKYQVVRCNGNECYCQHYADEHFNGDTSLIENPNDSWDDPDEQAEPEPPRKRFLGIF